MDNQRSFPVFSLIFCLTFIVAVAACATPTLSAAPSLTPSPLPSFTPLFPSFTPTQTATTQPTLAIPSATPLPYPPAYPLPTYSTSTYPPAYIPPPTPTPYPTFTPTSTPFSIQHLPAAKPYPLPTPYANYRLLYRKYAPEYGFYTINLDQTDERKWPILPHQVNSNARVDYLYVSPNGSQVVYLIRRDMEPFFGEIWSISPEGADPRLLIGAEGNCFPRDFIFSPDGAKIAYVWACWVENDFFETKGQIWVMEADGSNRRMISEHPSISKFEHWGTMHSISQGIFRWYRNGYIYFTARETQKDVYNLYAVHPDSGEVFRLADNISRDNSDLNFSPDGSRVIPFNEADDLKFQLAGFSIVYSANEPFVWNADNIFLVYQESIYSHYIGYQEDIFLRNVDTDEEHPLRPITDYLPHSAMFSPDGQYLAYSTFDGIIVIDIGQLYNATIPSGRQIVPPNAGAPRSRQPEILGWIPIP